MAIHAQNFGEFSEVWSIVRSEKQKSDPRRPAEVLANAPRRLEGGFGFVGTGNLTPERLERSHPQIITNETAGEKKEVGANFPRPPCGGAATLAMSRLSDV
jgi:hypothetical protein